MHSSACSLQVVYERLTRQQALDLLRQHLTANLVRLCFAAGPLGRTGQQMLAAAPTCPAAWECLPPASLLPPINSMPPAAHLPCQPRRYGCGGAGAHRPVASRRAARSARCCAGKLPGVQPAGCVLHLLWHMLAFFCCVTLQGTAALTPIPMPFQPSLAACTSPTSSAPDWRRCCSCTRRPTLGQQVRDRCHTSSRGSMGGRALQQRMQQQVQQQLRPVQAALGTARVSGHLPRPLHRQTGWLKVSPRWCACPKEKAQRFAQPQCWQQHPAVRALAAAVRAC